MPIVITKHALLKAKERGVDLTDKKLLVKILSSPKLVKPHRKKENFKTHLHYFDNNVLVVQYNRKQKLRTVITCWKADLESVRLNTKKL